MSTRIICTVDHRDTRGAAPGSLIAIHMDTDGPLDVRMENLRDRYPTCNLVAQPSEWVTS